MTQLYFDSPFHVTYNAEKASKIAMKVDLAIMIRQLIQEQGWTQAIAAEKLGVQQSRISDLTNLKLEKFTVDAILDLMDKFGYQLSVSIPSLNEATIQITKIQPHLTV